MVYNITSLPKEKKPLLRKAVIVGGVVLGGILAYTLANRDAADDVVEVEITEEETIEYIPEEID